MDRYILTVIIVNICQGITQPTPHTSADSAAAIYLWPYKESAHLSNYKKLHFIYNMTHNFRFLTAYLQIEIVVFLLYRPIELEYLGDMLCMIIFYSYRGSNISGEGTSLTADNVRQVVYYYVTIHPRHITHGENDRGLPNAPIKTAMT